MMFFQNYIYILTMCKDIIINLFIYLFLFLLLQNIEMKTNNHFNAMRIQIQKLESLNSL